MHIDLLADHVHHLPTIVSLLHTEWSGFAPWSDPQVIRQRLEAGCSESLFPKVFIAISDENDFLGTASVKLNELAHHVDKVHWLGEVYVRPDQRGQGIGTLLTEAAVTYAFGSGAERLFLYTPDQQELYTRLGWRMVGQEIINNEPVSLMVRNRDA